MTATADRSAARRALCAGAARAALLTVGLAFITLGAAGGTGCAFEKQFAVVEPGVLYRGSQPVPADLERVKREHGLKTVVMLRTDSFGIWTDYLKRLAEAERKWCRENGVRLVEFPMAPGTPPTPEYLSRFFRLVGDPASRPVLVHCYAGFERSAAFVAAYRIHKQKWDADQAVEEMNRYGYSSLFWPKQEEFVRAFAAASVAQSAVEVARRAPVP